MRLFIVAAAGLLMTGCATVARGTNDTWTVNTTSDPAGAGCTGSGSCSIMQALQAAGLTDVSITETHRVHPAAISAIVRATKPTDMATVTIREVDGVEAASCCSTAAQATCCEPGDKATCCSPEATAAGSCGCQ